MSTRFRPLVIAAAILVLISAAAAEGTRTWEQSRFEELVKGSTHGVAILSSGGLQLAPSLKALYTSPSTYLWSIAADDSGAVFAAAGAPARIYRITPDGSATVIFEPQELQVQALVADKAGVLYAATAPDGKVYRIEQRSLATQKPVTPGTPAPQATGASPSSSWSATVFFDPGTKYIWNLALDATGNLYVSTGDHGEIFKVTPAGQHSLFFKSDEVHIRALALDPQGNVIAGSDGSGLLYRIAPNGTGFVLYSAPKKEITALAIDGAGNIYAAAAGEKRPSNPPPNPPPAPGTQPATGAQGTGPFPAPGANVTGGSEIYRIAPDGSPTRLWTSREDLVYALAFDQRGTLLAGTGNRGHVFAIYGEDNFADLLRVGATQVTAFARTPSGGLYVSTSNFGKLFLLGPSSDPEGSYDSDVFDARIFSRWGRAEFRGQGNVELFTRSGNVDNPDRNWSGWKKADLAKDAALPVPSARFIQWRAVLHAGNPAPRLDSVLLNYLPKNIAPDIDDVAVQVGSRYPLATRATGNEGGSSRFDSPPNTVRDRGSVGVKWSAHDDNDDQMIYSLYYRGEGQSRWLLLEDGLVDKFYSFDAGLLPDGVYSVRVVASDAPSHSPSEALSSERESGRFEIDGTPPQVQALSAALEGNHIRVTFRASDSFSPIKRAEYSVDASDWQFIEPVGQLSDAKTESYDFAVALPGSAQAATGGESPGTDHTAVPPAPSSREHVVVVRVYDRYDNMISAKTVIPGR